MFAWLVLISLKNKGRIFENDVWSDQTYFSFVLNSQQPSQISEYIGSLKIIIRSSTEPKDPFTSFQSPLDLCGIEIKPGWFDRK